VVQVHVEREIEPWKQRGREGLCANTNVSLVCEREGRRSLFLYSLFVIYDFLRGKVRAKGNTFST
jgi:hypothetical protein